MRRAARGAERGGPHRDRCRSVVGAVAFGTLTVERPAGRRALTQDELLLLEAAAKQAAAALDRARLDARARDRAAGRRDQPAARGDVLLGHARPPHAAHVDQGGGHEPAGSRRVAYDAAQERELLTTILEETDRLNRLVGNILDLTKIRAGALMPTRQPAAIDEIVEAVVARMGPGSATSASRRKIREDLPDVMVDPVQIDQVLTNLIENAARHSPPGGEIQVSAVSRSATSCRCGSSDQGPGIPPEERERVFEAFYRGPHAVPRRPAAGSGSRS